MGAVASRSNYTASGALSALLDRLDGLRPTPNGWISKCPAHEDRHASLSIAEGHERPVVLFCFAGCKPDDIVRAAGLDPREILGARHGERTGRPASSRPPKNIRAVEPAAAERTLVRMVEHQIRNWSGEAQAVHVRKEYSDGSKDMPWRLPGNNDYGLEGRLVGSLPLYGTERLKSLKPGSTVIVGEGEGTAEALRERGFNAVGTVTGAGGTPDPDVLKALEAFEVYLWPDNDEDGRAHMGHVAAALADLGIESRMVEWKEAPHKGDAADLFEAGGTADDVERLLESATEIHSPATAAVPLGQDAVSPAGLVLLSDVTPELVRWLWPGRVPLGKMTVLDGDPGLGKSSASLDLAARVSAGLAMPDGAVTDLGGPAGVVLLSAEDSLADTIRPRLDAAGADTGRIAALAFVPGHDNLPSLPTLDNLADIRSAIQRVEARLVVVDPLMAYMPADTNAHRDQDVRSVLARLAALAEEEGVAVLVIRHLNKTAAGNPLYRGGGSIGIIGAARSGLLVAKDPDDPGGARRILVPTKSNLAALAPALAYEIQPAPNGALTVAWRGATEHTAAALLAAQSESADDRSALEEACDFLREMLQAGPRPATEVQVEARGAGIAAKTLERAKVQLGVRPKREGFGREGKWVWGLSVAIDRQNGHRTPTPEVGEQSADWRSMESGPPALSAHEEHAGVVEPFAPETHNGATLRPAGRYGSGRYTDPAGRCDRHNRFLSYPEQLRGACSTCEQEQPAGGSQEDIEELPF